MTEITDCGTNQFTTQPEAFKPQAFLASRIDPDRLESPELSGK